MRPPFEISAEAQATLGRIERLLGRYEGLNAPRPLPRLRRSLRVRTIHASLVIEGNALDQDQATTVLEGKRVSAPEKDILELRNAASAYDELDSVNPHTTKSLLAVHRILMRGLIGSAGRLRSGGVALARGAAIAHLAPPADRVRGLVRELFKFSKDQSIPLPVRAAVAHYELEFIHPFEDGNGRIGRFWHTLMLRRYHEAFEFIPLESVIREQQQQYYAALGACDAAGSSTEFVEFSLEVTEAALQQFMSTLRYSQPTTASHRLQRAESHFGGRSFSRKDYLHLFPKLSTASGSRDLRAGVDEGRLVKQGEKSQTRYRFREQ